jgi:hypothetical protein
VFYNPCRKVWCLSQRIDGEVTGRCRAYTEDADPTGLVKKASLNEKLTAEVLDQAGVPLEPFTRANCQPVSCDKTIAAVNWKRVPDLAALSGKPVRLRFHLKNGSLYSFWVSPDDSGASLGYVAAGGPGFTGPRDTVGKGTSD